ncbi:symmetrical bis(5'-nucleosyl)-tetraphosphatase [Thalassotalea psychrophila]|uniref:bis(5'-nucleosyl)-tetraphosphatase (symmetrical) n=1 Tax=Thalassotalea psychrophila TaxID=3065647 RepID=A0ABY9TSA3_9GAMM|nr:symmetrical bis(5'-nucleosyl)-tetraphosphatase [Colwelliaceae bacterium SQ149]
MAIYLLGDIQGCHTELCQLMKLVNFDLNTDQIWFTGDLVARGPDSLATLRLIKSLGNSAKVVLGNHDLHLLAVHAGIKKVKRNDLVDELLNSSDIDELMDWLAQYPLVEQLPNENAYMSHAGLPPEWQPEDALAQSNFVQERISGSERNHWLNSMYGNTPNSWCNAQTEEEKFRYSVNALTRMRFCFSDGSLEFTSKGSPIDNQDTNLSPWFKLSKSIGTTQWVFGHWASLNGEVDNPNIYALDTGCVWGGRLTMLRWHDKKIFSVPAQL